MLPATVEEDFRETGVVLPVAKTNTQTPFFGLVVLVISNQTET